MPGVGSRSFVAGHFSIELEGADAGFIQSVNGGAIRADVINQSLGPTSFVKKHIGPPKYEPFTIQIGLGMRSSIYDWIAASLKMNYIRKNGSIVSHDFKLQATGEREFFNALITEVGFPAMDAAAKDPCYLTLTFAPEYTRHKPAGTATPSPVTTPPDAWLPSNFRLEIDGLDCSRVIRIDAFTVKQKTVGDSIGDPRDQLKEPGQIEFPNLAITMAETAVPTWLDWFESFVVKGRNDETQEKRGALVFLSPNRLTELGRVTFYNLGIFRMAPAMAEPTADQRPRMTADLYCERMEYSMHMPSLDGVAG
jgi:hypothetical protein